MRVFRNISELVGNTPLVEISNYASENNCHAALLCKLEGKNPAGSTKDRVARQMIDAAEKNGILKKGATIIEPTSGNTGIGLAAIGASKGYRVILTMPDTMSVERIKLIFKILSKLVILADVCSKLFVCNPARIPALNNAYSEAVGINFLSHLFVLLYFIKDNCNVA